MGNCQAIDAATLVIQHPNGKVDKLYWPVFASEIMKMNPGHYVALLISTTTFCPAKDKEKCPSKKDHDNNNPVRLTRIKILKPTDSLVLGQVYRLITSHEVMKGLLAKKQAKMRKNQPESAAEKPDKAARSEPEDNEILIPIDIIHGDKI
ncbi:D-ribose-binding periplasmic protein [Quillaja saponaria]|uniref:D-ribose-binding periplasmic protein n=1 Tax=Quillaja saponaria TaxID=32244 RepID=A0AAD7LDR6_QUISA|nr:D-ribose-binding periplasmic protein [Quillaja saponaria]